MCVDSRFGSIKAINVIAPKRQSNAKLTLCSFHALLLGLTLIHRPSLYHTTVREETCRRPLGIGICFILLFLLSLSSFDGHPDMPFGSPPPLMQIQYYPFSETTWDHFFSVIYVLKVTIF